MVYLYRLIIYCIETAVSSHKTGAVIYSSEDYTRKTFAEQYNVHQRGSAKYVIFRR